ncbi:hypothetical protein [Mycoplasma struthionis]|uniref:hypothetical protein n=1 Tax=Mycoplasma struthionis TaxID=538220 RepID=UPI0021BD318E|nr:hypothetical protein [Mycoplasma struthionis]
MPPVVPPPHDAATALIEAVAANDETAKIILCNFFILFKNFPFKFKKNKTTKNRPKLFFGCMQCESF